MLLFDSIPLTSAMSSKLILLKVSLLITAFSYSSANVFNRTLSHEIKKSESYPLSPISPSLSNATINSDDDDDDDEDFIFGGEPAEPAEFPFMAALGWRDGSGKLKFHGGGMLISPKMVLTAAHCAYKDGKLPDIIYVGGNSLPNEPSPVDIFYQYSVVNVTIFPDYNPNQGYDDIAILELNTTAWASPICLWRNPILSSKDVKAIGYGLTEFAGLGSQNLLKVNLTVFSSDYCEPFFKRQRKFKLGLSSAHICAGDKDGTKDTCQGDSGGPLILKHNDKMFAVGITSSGQACSGFPPAIYTKIFPYINWIAEVLGRRGEILKTCMINKI